MKGEEIIKALDILKEWQTLAYHNDDGTDEGSHELYWALAIVFKHISHQNAEIERLNKVEYVLPARHCGKKLMVRFRLHDIRAEAIKEFVERLKEEYRGFDETHHQIFYSSLVACIDNLVKEMVGEHDV